MASITKRGDYQYQAEVRRKGHPVQRKTFETKKEAQAWAAVIESEMTRGVFVDRSEAEKTTLGEALSRYAREVTECKKSRRTELSCIRKWLAHPLADRSLASLRAVDFAQYRDSRLKFAAANTVRLELALVSNLFTVARKEWSIAVDNPISHIRKPSPGRPRDRRLVNDEEKRLMAGALASHAEALPFAITLAIETGMRAGEIVGLRWKQVDLATGVIRLSQTKNGECRIVPLSVQAAEAIRAQPRPIGGGRLTRFYDSNGLAAAFRIATRRAGLENLKFHDLRHEAASRLAKKMPVQTLAKVFGWKTLQMAMRYYNPSETELVAAVRAAA